MKKFLTIIFIVCMTLFSSGNVIADETGQIDEIESVKQDSIRLKVINIADHGNGGQWYTIQVRVTNDMDRSFNIAKITLILINNEGKEVKFVEKYLYDGLEANSKIYVQFEAFNCPEWSKLLYTIQVR